MIRRISIRGRCWIGSLAALLAFHALVHTSDRVLAAPVKLEPGSAPELLANPRFAEAAQGQFEKTWQVWQPSWDTARIDVDVTSRGLVFSATNRPFAVGGVSQIVTGLQHGQAYAVQARGTVAGVRELSPDLLLRVEWRHGTEVLHPAGVLARGPRVSADRFIFEDVLTAPADADAARVSLEVRWPRGAEVVWGEASFRPTEASRGRKVKVGTVYLRPRNSTPSRNLDLWCAQVDEAGKLGLDIVCLSEAILMVGTTASHADVAEAIPGPSTERLGEASRRNHCWVVAGLMERDGTTLYNTAVLLDRAGQLAGRYRKVHLPREEWLKGITPGHDYPVFKTDFGTIGIQVCYDYFFPEPAQILARRGAEILFAPTWGTTFADEDGRAEGQTVFRVRARDAGLFVVPSVYDGDSLVVDPLGRILASSRGQSGVFWAEIDLDRREPLWWVGEWRELGPRDRRADTYR